MTESAASRDGRRWARLAWGRLRQNRVMLAAGCLALFAIHAVGEGSIVFAAAMGLFLLLVAATASGRGERANRMAATLLEPPSDDEPGLTAEGLAAAVGDPLIVFDNRGVVVFANAAAKLAFGDLQPGISLPMKFRAPELQELLESVLSGFDPSQSIDFVERVPIDRAYRVAARGVGRGTGLFVLTFRDMSETRRVDRMRADFIANASHELRTPLASISGFVETLRGPAKNDPAARERFLEIMQNQTSRMARLIDDLLSLSRLEMKTGLASGKRIDLSGLVREVADSLNPLAVETGVAIDNRIPHDPIAVEGEKDELFQVFENLLENACKYGQSGGRVVIDAGETQGSVGLEATVTIRDFGTGIAAEHIPRITERFYRVDVANSRAQKGTGLGLAIVKHILTRHRGRLAVASKVGEGSAFTVHLPLAKS